jgi:septal ring factor EnvC (AmiA/AmiB activator)
MRKIVTTLGGSLADVKDLLANGTEGKTGKSKSLLEELKKKLEKLEKLKTSIKKIDDKATKTYRTKKMEESTLRSDITELRQKLAFIAPKTANKRQNTFEKRVKGVIAQKPKDEKKAKEKKNADQRKRDKAKKKK